MRTMLFMLLLTLIAGLASAQDIVPWNGPAHVNPGDTAYFDQQHDESYAYDALELLSGTRLPDGSTREDFASEVLKALDALRPYGQKSTANIRPEIPNWLTDGYSLLQPAVVAKSRYLNGVLGGTLAPDADLGALYAFYCVYDAEWFSVSRNAAYRTWLSALLTTYPPEWQRLRPQSEWDMHGRLVTPLQTKDEPYREIDNWIGVFVKEPKAFAKPKVRDALIEELIWRGGMDADKRFIAAKAYDGATPELGLTPKQFYLLAGLSLEYAQEIYALDPANQQILHVRDYFLERFNALTRP